MSADHNLSARNKIRDIKARYQDNIVALYGIGSYFDRNLPSSWKRDDIDIIIIVKLIKRIPKKEWEDRFKTKRIFNTLEAYNNKKLFHHISPGTNYEWALMELKSSENSVLLFGKDIRQDLPDISNLTFDYDDILARGFYHLEKSLKEGVTDKAKTEYTKGIFKIAFYFCILLGKSFRYTSLIKIGEVLKKIRKSEVINQFFEESMIYRMTGEFRSHFITIRSHTIKYIFSLLDQGKLHRVMNSKELTNFLSSFFRGFPLLRKEAQKMHLGKKTI